MRRSTPTGERVAATHVSLDSLSVHRLEPGHYIAPLLCSGSTTLPFAVGLELFSSTCQEEAASVTDAALPERPESEGLLSLQYILDGRAQVCCSTSTDNACFTMPISISILACPSFKRAQVFLNVRVCWLQVAGTHETLSAQAGDTLLSRSSSGTLSSNSSATRFPVLQQHAQQDYKDVILAQDPEQDATIISLSEVATSSPPPLCMDAELQWDAAILTVMVDSHAEANAGERGKLLYSTAFLLPEE